MSVFASQLRLPIAEIELPYGKRPEGSTSKLSSVRDGARIGMAFLALFKTVKPVAFFGTLAATAGLASIGLAFPLLIEFLQTGLVPRIPTAILCTGLMLTALLLAISGLIIGAITRAQAENMRLFYLATQANRTDPAEQKNDEIWFGLEQSEAVRTGEQYRATG